MVRLGTGIGWRPEIADAVEAMAGIDWVEVVAENVCPGHLPDSLRRLAARGVTVVPHGVSLGLGGADRPDEGRLTALAERAEALRAPLVTEHIAFVRAGGPLTASPRLEAGHLLPVPRTRDALDVLCANIRLAQQVLPVPLAVENIAALISWPGEELTEGQFLYELADRTGVRLLIDVANLHTNHVNRGEDPAEALAGLPLEAIAYVHVAGGFERDGVWHDSHAHPVPRPVLGILTDLASRVRPPGVLLERDDDFPEAAGLERELDSIRQAVAAGLTRREPGGERTARPAGAPRPRRGADGRAPGVVRRPVPAPGPAADGAAPPDGTTAPALTAAVPPAPSADGTVPPDDITAADGTVPPDGVTAADGTVPPDGVTAADGTVPPDGLAAADGATDAPPVAAASLPAPGSTTGGSPGRAPGDAVRQRLGLAQAALLSALVAGTPVPEGFDRARLRVQSRALAGKRADVVAKVAPELPVILGDGYRAAFLGYARRRPMADGYRHDALAFAEHLLRHGGPDGARARRELRTWWLDRSGPAPRRRPRTRLARATRSVLLRR